MFETALHRISSASDRSIGLALVGIGIVWISLSGMASGIDAPGRAILPLLALSIDVFGVVHLVGGLFVLGWTYSTDRDRMPFATAAIGSGIALVSAAAVLIVREGIERGVLDLEVLISFPFFICYVAAWLLPIGAARGRRQRAIGLVGMMAAPIGLLAVLPILFLFVGGWTFLIAMASVGALFGLLLSTAVLASPLLVAGWALGSSY